MTEQVLQFYLALVAKLILFIFIVFEINKIAISYRVDCHTYQQNGFWQSGKTHLAIVPFVKVNGPYNNE